MDKAQAIHEFWSGFGLDAYDENTVDENASMPYITYNVSTGKMDDILTSYANLWYWGTSWRDISLKADQIARAIGERGYYIMKIDGGYMVVTQGTPFAQRMSEPSDDMIRRIYLSVTMEFLTAY